MSHTTKTRGDFQLQNHRNQFQGPEVDQNHFRRTKRRNSRNRSRFLTSGRIIIKSKKKSRKQNILMRISTKKSKNQQRVAS